MQDFDRLEGKPQQTQGTGIEREEKGIRNKMKMANISFDDPENLADPSRIFIDVMADLELLDYARRYFERKGGHSFTQRANEIRKLYKQIIRDYVYIVRSIIPDRVIDNHIKLRYDKLKSI
jgi:hypothetical protein